MVTVDAQTDDLALPHSDAWITDVLKNFRGVVN
jgi:hypothetical protein